MLSHISSRKLKGCCPRLTSSVMYTSLKVAFRNGEAFKKAQGVECPVPIKNQNMSLFFNTET